jgi:hypothetical protein
MQFDRVASVIVGKPGQVGTRIDSVRIRFRVEKTDKPDANQVEAELYNLAPETRSKCQDRDAVIVISAGYKSEGEQVIGIGDVHRYETLYPAPEIITRINCGDGLNSLRESRTTLSYKPGVPLKQILGDIAKSMNLKQLTTDAILNGTYRNGFAFSGQSSEALSKVTNAFGLDWSIQNGHLQITEKGKPANKKAVLLTPETGLIGSPQRVDDVSTDSKKHAKMPGIKVECLLNPRIEPGGVIEVRSREQKGFFKVITVEHRGDTHSDDWKSTVEAVEYA